MNGAGRVGGVSVFFKAEFGRGRRVGLALDARSRQVSAASARGALPRAACAPHSAAAQQVQEENCQRAGAQ